MSLHILCEYRFSPLCLTFVPVPAGMDSFSDHCTFSPMIQLDFEFVDEGSVAMALLSGVVPGFRKVEKFAYNAFCDYISSIFIWTSLRGWVGV